jgi:glucose-1-phosphate cytidylyltransferase
MWYCYLRREPAHQRRTFDVKAVILAGGFGTRISEETIDKPKPLVTVGGRPILWHIMKILDAHGIHEFVIALGYRGEAIKRYFMDFHAIDNDITVDLSSGTTTIHASHHPRWKVHLVDTGLHTQTGGRLRRLQRWIGDETFLFTYGDGVADIDVAALVKYHKEHGRLATVTSVRPPSRFGNLVFDGDAVTSFHEKHEIGDAWINGGYFILEPGAIDYVSGDADAWEQGPVEALARDGHLVGYRHYGFWSCMDTLKERNSLEELWSKGAAPWRIWDAPGERVRGVPT